MSGDNYTRAETQSRLDRVAPQREYITEHRNLVFITGATGEWKDLHGMRCGMEACKRRYTTKYVRLQTAPGVRMARNDGTYKRSRANMPIRFC